jgi:serine/threonine protein kinase/tetratricopeptide (TPR) repeat protein
MLATYTQGDEPVPGYRLVRMLGWGRFGEVWLARAPGGFESALKFISLGNKHGIKEYVAIRLFKQIRHPNLIPLNALWLKDKQGNFIDDDVIAETGNLQGQAAELVLAMGLGDKSLFDRLKECQEQLKLPGVPAPELLGYMEHTAAVLDYLHLPAHNLGHGTVAIQHCDIKPQNILIVGRSAQVCDLGVAQVLEDARATQAMGSAAYIAPECIRDGRPSTATDQYSLAVTYAELRSGVLPIRARSIAAAYMAHMEGKLDLTHLPAPEQQVVRKATSLEPGDRYPDLQSLVAALREAFDIGEKAGFSVPPLGDVPMVVEEESDDEIDIGSKSELPAASASRTIVMHEPRRGALEEGSWSSVTLWGSMKPRGPQLPPRDETKPSEEAWDPGAPQTTTETPAGPVETEAPPIFAEAPVAIATPPVRHRSKTRRHLLLLSLAAGIGLFAAATISMIRQSDNKTGLWRLFGWGKTEQAENGPGSAVDPEQPGDLLQQAENKVQDGDTQGALADCNRLIAERPHDVAAWELLARVRFASRDTVQARYDAEKTIELDPARSEPHYIRGRMLAQDHNFDAAVDEFEHAIRLNETDGRYRFWRTNIVARWSSAKLDTLIDDLDRQAEQRPGSVILNVDRAYALLLQGRNDLALQGCNAAIELNGRCALAYAVRAEAHRNMGGSGNLQQAIADAGMAIELDSKCTLAYYVRSNAAYELGIKANREQILADLDSATALDPFMTECFRKRGDLYSALGNWDRADADWAVARKLEQ